MGQGRRRIPERDRVDFLRLMCGGSSLKSAASSVGVAGGTATMWWRSSGLVDVKIAMGPVGGLAGSAPASSVGAGTLRRALSSEDRAVIAAGLTAGWSYGRIGAAIGRNRSVVCREVRRNSSPDGRYWAPVAHRAAHERRRRPKVFKLIQNPGLCRRIEAWMDDGWSPGLIARVLAEDAGTQMMDRVSHETIYQALYVQSRGSLRKELHRCLSTKRAARRSRDSEVRRSPSPYKEALKISQRPAEVADRAVPGHWEGDLIIGTASGSAIGTLVERQTRFVMLLHLPGSHDAATVAEAMIAQMRQLPEHLRRSITWDRGVELAKYRDIQLALNTSLYFCDPHSPWQRGSNENTNRLLRHWFEKGSDLSIHTADDLARVAATLNDRPRPTLNMQTPAQAMTALLSTPDAA